MNTQSLVGLSVLAIILGLGAGLLSRGATGITTDVPTPHTFVECEQAGYPVQESFPRRCTAPSGDVFTEDVQENTQDVVTDTSCVVAGCSAQLCVEAIEAPHVVTTCEVKPEYMCYEKAACERQLTGRCGWTESDEFTTCMASATVR